MDILNSLIAFTLEIALPETFRWVVFLAVLWIPFILFEYAWSQWVTYVQMKWMASVKKTILEVKLPRETDKSPLAMESVLNSIHNTSDGTWISKYWKGELRPRYSLELISEEGRIKFMIWVEDRRKQGIMAALYSQYPGIEIHEREDYADKVEFDPETMKVWAAEFKFTKEDPYPIKTYVDYGLDKNPKEEHKVDPLAPVIEWLGTVGQHQHVWFQLIVRAHKGDQKKPGHWFATTDLWKDKAQELTNKIMMRDPKTKVVGDPKGESKGIIMLSKIEEETVAALSRSITKPAFDVGIRAIYLATKKDAFNTPFGIGGIISSFKNFNTNHLNGFAPNGEKWIPSITEYPWQDFSGKKRIRMSAEIIDLYRRRAYFDPPYGSDALVLNAEELATVYHFPGSTAATPTLERIPSKRANAPSNLPI